MEELIGTHGETLFGHDFLTEVTIEDTVLRLELRTEPLVAVDLVRCGSELNYGLSHNYFPFLFLVF